MSFCIMCFFKSCINKVLKDFSVSFGTKKVAYFFCGSSTVTWSNSGDKNSGEELGPPWALLFILHTALGRRGIFQVQIPDGH